MDPYIDSMTQEEITTALREIPAPYFILGTEASIDELPKIYRLDPKSILHNETGDTTILIQFFHRKGKRWSRPHRYSLITLHNVARRPNEDDEYFMKRYGRKDRPR